jgi:hypothetical protein
MGGGAVGKQWLRPTYTATCPGSSPSCGGWAMGLWEVSSHSLSRISSHRGLVPSPRRLSPFFSAQSDLFPPVRNKNNQGSRRGCCNAVPIRRIILSADENDRNKYPSCGKAITTSDSTWENGPLFYYDRYIIYIPRLPASNRSVEQRRPRTTTIGCQNSQMRNRFDEQQ